MADRRRYLGALAVLLGGVWFAPAAAQAPTPADLRKAMAATFRDEALVVGAARAEAP